MQKKKELASTDTELEVAGDITIGVCAPLWLLPGSRQAVLAGANADAPGEAAVIWQGAAFRQLLEAGLQSSRHGGIALALAASHLLILKQISGTGVPCCVNLTRRRRRLRGGSAALLNSALNDGSYDVLWLAGKPSTPADKHL
ncbi:hypothetical protein QQF64_035083 [Cirrhinus molitorella]|uniref:Uncharacterized protein n=1 Tax=Cirrhinus molitorella TaxID=172907 RepID=A0ABR3NES5_9TELE